jgi:hypothetical protein
MPPLTTTDRYQVLSIGTSISEKYAIIELKESSTKPFWKIYIPDAGDRASATKVARLLNKENVEYLESQAKREADTK